MIKNQIVISIYYKNIGFIGQKSAKTCILLYKSSVFA